MSIDPGACPVFIFLIHLEHCRVVSVHLPEGARQPVCKFRWWQPVHSGSGQDVWAVDDVSLTSQMYNTIKLDMANPKEVKEVLEIHLGDLDMYCGRLDTLK